MNEKDHILILKSLAGETTPDEQRRVERLRADDPTFSLEYERTRNMEDALQQSAWESFGPSFADRLLERLGAENLPSVSIGDLMARIFSRFAPVGVALAVILAAWNVSTAEEGVSPVEATLGLEPVDLASGYNTVLSEFATEFDDVGTFDTEVGE